MELHLPDRIFGWAVARPLLLAILCAAGVSAPADAQNTQAIGSSSFTGMSFACVTYPGGEDIEVVKRNGKTRIMDTDEATRLVERGHGKVSGKLIRAQEQLVKKDARRQKLLASPLIALPRVAREIERLKEEIAELEDETLPTLVGQRSELEQLRNAVEGCGEIPTVLEGSNVIQIGTTDLPLSGWQGYMIAALHVFPLPPGVGGSVCVSRNGGAFETVSIRYEACTTYNDGPGTHNPVVGCYDSVIPEGHGIISIFGGAAGYFHQGRYEDDLEHVTEFLSTQVEMFVPTTTRNCPL